MYCTVLFSHSKKDLFTIMIAAECMYSENISREQKTTCACERGLVGGLMWKTCCGILNCVKTFELNSLVQMIVDCLVGCSIL